MARTEKSYKIASGQIQPLATGRGACIASDMITVDGRKVAFMYRELPDNDLDSGWRFLSGLESQEYMDDVNNHAVYDVNTIANYDQDIIPLLDSPAGAAFERIGGTGAFLKIQFEPPED